MTASTPSAATYLLTSGHTSLMHGWVPVTIQAAAAVVLLTNAGRRSRRWWLLWLPVAAGTGVAAATVAHWYMADAGLAGEPAPYALWVWVALTAAAGTALVLGWRGAAWWRRGGALIAVPLCLLCAALVLNSWVGYFPDVQAAWNQAAAGPLPDQTDQATVKAMVAKGTRPPHGTVVPVTVPADASHFKHRGELVYLPPEWFESSPPPALPAVLMIGGQFNTPADWTRAGNAIKTIDDFAAQHGGSAPVLVFVDSGGTFNNDTECVNGPRGNAADHLTKDVVPYMISAFGVSPDRSRWGVAGWSMGGTCAVDLTVMHPELFSAFVDIAGDYFPNAGTRAQTISRLFGGDAAAFAAFDPSTVMTKHGPYAGVSGWFAISATGPATARSAGRDAPVNPSNQTAAAYSLCALGAANGIDCAVVPQPGRHDWQFAARTFAASLPWLAGRLGTSGAPRIELPGAGDVPGIPVDPGPPAHTAPK